MDSSIQTRDKQSTGSIITSCVTSCITFYSIQCFNSLYIYIHIGLAWSAMGGEIMFVEATKMPGTGELVLTGQLGEYMYLCLQFSFCYPNSSVLPLFTIQLQTALSTFRYCSDKEINLLIDIMISLSIVNQATC